MGSTKSEPYFVFMSYDPEYERLRADRSKRGAHELDLYISRKHDEVLANTLEPGTYNKTSSLVIVDGFAVEITEEQGVGKEEGRSIIHYDTCAPIIDEICTNGEKEQQRRRPIFSGDQLDIEAYASLYFGRTKIMWPLFIAVYC
ncbi:hypothetical protein PIB30_027282 [Stylosanthes scabra]|uniref:Uncharacterized protein n=1 Tax=Stylosanthes scabra TaxID=79078 RepID=A0ABU6XAP9_9FABA|nr:hypothetical protein [Stylosanthes scabra]